MVSARDLTTDDVDARDTGGTPKKGEVNLFDKRNAAALGILSAWPHPPVQKKGGADVTAVRQGKRNVCVGCGGTTKRKTRNTLYQGRTPRIDERRRRKRQAADMIREVKGTARARARAPKG